MAQCGTCVNRLYKSVIEEVIAGVKESFLDEGIDDQVLTDLKQQWEAKLAATKAAEHSELAQQQHQQQLQHQQQQQQQQQQQAAASQQSQAAQPAQPSGTAMALVPVQITVPSQQAGGNAKTITIHVPSTALSSGIAGPQLQSILSSPAAAQTFALEPTQAAEIIQRQLNTALQANGVVLPPQLLQYNHPVSSQVDGPVDYPLSSGSKSRKSKGRCSTKSLSKCKLKSQVLSKTKRENGDEVLVNDVEVKVSTEILDNVLIEGLRSSQIDGAHGLGDSSDEISDDDDDDDDDDKDEDKKEKDDDDEDDVEDDAWNDDPLNSDDDVSEDDGGDIFETENVVVCQYDKITRVRNKWKFHLKDGIMNLKGKDYVFTKANGEGEW